MEIQENVTLAPYTTLQVGGAARYFVVVETVDELQQARQFAQQIAAPVLVLGSGSNILVSDEGFDGLVVHNQIKGRTYDVGVADNVSATYGAGEDFDSIVADSISHGYWGLENLSHIPGTVGATPIQNVGAYGVEVSSLVTHVQAMSLETGGTKTFSNTECQFAYRDSYFKTDVGRQWVVTSVTYQLQQTDINMNLEYADLATLADSGSPLTAQSIRKEIIRIRSGKFPDWHTVGTAGSFFKNPVITQGHLETLLRQYPDLPSYVQPDGLYKIPLGWVLDKVCDLKGYATREVGLYKNQALVLINHGGSATNIQDLVDYVSTMVYDKTQIAIEPEVRFV